MKFVCMKCETFMTFQKVENPAEQALGIEFMCQTCGARIAMVTNPGETALVSALGVKIGGKEAAPTPMEFTRESLKENGGTSISPPVQQEMLKAEMDPITSSGKEGVCPFGSMLAKMREGTAEQPAQMVWTQEAKERMERVPSFLRPMIEMGVEGYAKRVGITTITPEVLDASKNDPGEMIWSKEAQGRLQNIPSFIRPMARKEIERIARERGLMEVTPELMDESKSKFLGLGY